MADQFGRQRAAVNGGGLGGAIRRGGVLGDWRPRRQMPRITTGRAALGDIKFWRTLSGMVCSVWRRNRSGDVATCCEFFVKFTSRTTAIWRDVVECRSGSPAYRRSGVVRRSLCRVLVDVDDVSARQFPVNVVFVVARVVGCQSTVVVEDKSRV